MEINIKSNITKCWHQKQLNVADQPMNVTKRKIQFQKKSNENGEKKLIANA